MAAQTALVIVNGTFERIPAADTLQTGVGVVGSSTMTVASASVASATGNLTAVQGGNVTVLGAGGGLTLVGGAAAGSNQNGGTTSLDSGLATGSGSSTVSIGTTNATAINVGHGSVPITITGAVTFGADIAFTNTGPHQIYVVASTVGVGQNLTVASGSGGAGSAGGVLNLNAGAGATTGAGGALNVNGGAAPGAGLGGPVTMTSGASATGTAGDVTIDGGVGAVANGSVLLGTTNAAIVSLGNGSSNEVKIHNGAALNPTLTTIYNQFTRFERTNGAGVYDLYVRNSTSGAGGGLAINAGSATSASDVGGDVSIASGYGFGGGTGGTLLMYAGDAGATGNGAITSVWAGGGGATSGVGGAMQITGGQGWGTVSSTGGAVHVYGGDANTIGTGGAVLVLGGNSKGATFLGGAIQVAGGIADTAAGGSVSIDGGTGVSASGTISIGTQATASYTTDSIYLGGGASTHGYVKIHGTGGALNTGVLTISNATTQFAAATAGGTYALQVAPSASGNVAANLTIAAGASTAANAGALTLNGGSATTSGTGGSVSINAGSGAPSGDIVLGAANTNSVKLSANAVVQAGATLSTAGTGNINLPNNGSARFKIETVAVSANVTAANLGTLTAGPTSNADALHTHAVEGMAAVAGQALAVGQVIAFYNGGAAYAWLASATDAQKHETVGICTTAAAGSTSPTTVQTNGEASIPDGFWDTAGGAMVPDATKVGTKVWLSNVNPGNLTTLAPSGSGTWIQKVGVVTKQSTGGFTKVVLLVADSIYLP